MPSVHPITVERSGGVHIITVHSIGTQVIEPEPLHAALSKVLDAQAQSPRFVLNLDEIEGAGSRLIAVIMQFNMHVLKRKGQLRFCGVRAHVKEVFELTRLSSILSIFPSRQDALRDFD